MDAWNSMRIDFEGWQFESGTKQETNTKIIDIPSEGIIDLYSCLKSLPGELILLGKTIASFPPPHPPQHTVGPKAAH